MKTKLLYITIGLLTPIALVSFIVWDTNPSNWDMGWRFTTAIGSTICAIIGHCIAKDEEDK
jgi:hypothetical protein